MLLLLLSLFVLLHGVSENGGALVGGPFEGCCTWVILGYPYFGKYLHEAFLPHAQELTGAANHFRELRWGTACLAHPKQVPRCGAADIKGYLIEVLIVRVILLNCGGRGGGGVGFCNARLGISGRK